MRAPVREVLEGWAGARHARSWVYRPSDAEEVALALEDAGRRGLTVVHRGAGLSYGDAALNQGGAVLDATGLTGVLEVDGEAGRIRAGAGTTVEDVWRAVLPLGWWPPVVPGSMKATLGGCVALDVHGKNHVRQGSFGEHVQALTLLEPGGQPAALDARADAERFARVVGAQGLTGTILDVTLALRRAGSGYLDVESLAAPSLEATLEAFEQRGAAAGHAVGWTDCMGPRAGRSLLHFADELPEDHRLAGRGLALADQLLPERVLGFLPRRWAWRALAPFARDGCVRALNALRYASGSLRSGGRHPQPIAAFHFLLDSVPGWKRVYRPHGFVQYQLFVPGAAARYAMGEALRLQREAGVFSYLGVLKRHRAGGFSAPYTLDGYSLALDFPVRPALLVALAALCRSYRDLLLEVGGRIYAAKDAVGVGRLPSGRHPLFSSDLVRRWERGVGAC